MVCDMETAMTMSSSRECISKFLVGQWLRIIPILLLIMSSVGSQQVPTPRDYGVGANMTLLCMFPESTENLIIWEKGSRNNGSRLLTLLPQYGIIHNAHSDTRISGAYLKNQTEGASSFELQIINITRADYGRYTCYKLQYQHNCSIFSVLKRYDVQIIGCDCLLPASEKYRQMFANILCVLGGWQRPSAEREVVVRVGGKNTTGFIHDAKLLLYSNMSETNRGVEIEFQMRNNSSFLRCDIDQNTESTLTSKLLISKMTTVQLPGRTTDSERLVPSTSESSSLVSKVERSRSTNVSTVSSSSHQAGTPSPLTSYDTTPVQIMATTDSVSSSPSAVTLTFFTKDAEDPITQREGTKVLGKFTDIAATSTMSVAASTTVVTTSEKAERFALIIPLAVCGGMGLVVIGVAICAHRRRRRLYYLRQHQRCRRKLNFLRNEHDSLFSSKQQACTSTDVHESRKKSSFNGDLGAGDEQPSLSDDSFDDSYLEPISDFGIGEETARPAGDLVLSSFEGKLGEAKRVRALSCESNVVTVVQKTPLEEDRQRHGQEEETGRRSGRRLSRKKEQGSAGSPAEGTSKSAGGAAGTAVHMK